MAATDQRFGFAFVKQQLSAGDALDPLQEALDRDYRVVSYLLNHAAAFGVESFERRLMLIDYSVMRVWYRLTRSAAPQHARRALSEMASILEYLAHSMGEQAGVESEA